MSELLLSTKSTAFSEVGKNEGKRNGEKVWGTTTHIDPPSLTFKINRMNSGSCIPMLHDRNHLFRRVFGKGHSMCGLNAENLDGWILRERGVLAGEGRREGREWLRYGPVIA